MTFANIFQSPGFILTKKNNIKFNLETFQNP